MISEQDDEIFGLSTEAAAIAIESKTDLRVYTKNVEEELEKLEIDSINAYVRMSPDISVLHKQISSCCKTLERMESILSIFHRDLGAISSDIQDLQTRSLAMHQRMQNRQSIRGELSQFLSDIVIPEAMIKNIILAPVTDQDFIECLHELNHKITFVNAQSIVDYPSIQDIDVILKKMKFKAVSKIREFLMEKIKNLRKPMANYQVPQNQILKFRYFYEFLLAHEKPIAKEIRLTYIETMEKVYFSYFKTYTSKLHKFQIDSYPEKDELVGKNVEDFASGLPNTAHANSKVSLRPSPAQSTIAHIRHGQFGLGDRAERLLNREGLQASILLPHAAAKTETFYPVEEVFRCVNYALLDTTSREFIFLGDFFLHGFESPASKSNCSHDNYMTFNGNSEFASIKTKESSSNGSNATNSLFIKVFGRTLHLMETTVVPQIISTGAYDLLGLLLCVQLTHEMVNLLMEREVAVTSKYWKSILEMLWSKIVDRLETHISSLRLLDVAQFSQATATYLPLTRGSSINEAAAINLTPRAYCLIRPHPVARRYAELAASLHMIGKSNSKQPAQTPLISNSKNPSGSPNSSSVIDSRTRSSTDSLDARITLSLSRMHVEFEAVCYRLSKAISRERLRLVFLINNFDFFISVLSEKGAGSASEVQRCREAVALHTGAYIDQALLPYFGSMISFIKTVEQRTPAGSITFKEASEVKDVQEEGRGEEGRVTHIVKGFNIDWKNSIEKINGEIMLEFANFTLGTQIFQALLSQFVQLYHRFQKVMTMQPYNSMPVRNQIVSIHQVMNEIKRFKSSY